MNQEMIIVTPAIASAYLAMNAGNRPLTASHVMALANTMRRGEWIFNGDAIRITKSGNLIDGQHRLNAIIECGLPQKAMVVTGLDDDAFLTIDAGRPRGASDTLAIQGYQCTSALSTAARYIININSVSQSSLCHQGAGDRSTPTQILGIIKANPKLQDSAKYGVSKKAKRYLGSGLLSFCHFWFIKHDYVAGTNFFDEIDSGDFSYKYSPALALKEKLIDNLVDSKKLNRDEKAAYVFLAFNKYLEGAQVKRLNLKKDKKEWFKLG
jgi:hypothetical protein